MSEVKCVLLILCGTSMSITELLKSATIGVNALQNCNIKILVN